METRDDVKVELLVARRSVRRFEGLLADAAVALAAAGDAGARFEAARDERYAARGLDDSRADVMRLEGQLQVSQ